MQAFTGSGTFLYVWGSPGSGAGQFQYPIGVGVDLYGGIYVLDQYNSRVQKFGPTPTPTRSISWGSLKARYR
jgi:hypothetical protein